MIELYTWSTPNGQKASIMLEEVELPYRVHPIDIGKDHQFHPDFLAIAPNNKIPAIIDTDNGLRLMESGAILLYLADGTDFLPGGGVERARVHQWMFFEQNRIEADLAVARFMRLAGRDATFPEAFANRLDRGRDALATLERSLADGGRFLAGDAYTIADIAVYGYGHCAGDAGADPRAHPHVAAWLDRVEAAPGFVNDLEPVPSHVAERPI
jgi:glutathione S-transferase